MPWLAIVLVGAASYALRVSPALAAGHMRPRPRLERALGQMTPAVLAALVVNAVLRHDGAGGPADTAAVLAALAVGGALAARRLPTLASVVGGLASYWIAIIVVGAILSG